MSASLVGSEMCIRDSASSSRSWQGWAEPVTLDEDEGVAWYDPEAEDQLDYTNVPANIAGQELMNMLIQLK
eukprot:12733984-Alexandrium_andersonii.AAC.1